MNGAEIRVFVGRVKVLAQFTDDAEGLAERLLYRDRDQQRHASKMITGTRASVLVRFSAGNIEHVAPLVSGKRYMFASNDSLKTGHGEKSAKAAGLPCCMSEVDSYDANDIRIKQGLMKVTQLIMQARRA
jgi:hypothetical protein